MDLRNFETTSTYAIEAVYTAYYDLIPEDCRVKDPIVKQYKNPPTTQDHPLSTDTVDNIGAQSDQDYFYNTDDYDAMDLTPFYDPELSFENRLHYKIVNMEFPKRTHPWYIITWNCGKGILKSSLTNRRFQSSVTTNDLGESYKFKFLNVDMDMTLAFTSNSMQALFELQENIVIGRRIKSVEWTKPHSVLGKFPVAFDLLDSDITKMPRDKGTLCSLLLHVKVDFPIIGEVIKVPHGRIYEIHSEIDSEGKSPDEKIVYATDIINSETEINDY